MSAPHSVGAVVPILLYHAVTEQPGTHVAPFTVTPSMFERHLDVVQAAGVECLTLSDLLVARARGTVDARRQVVITFDDGYADFVDAALPALTARAMPSTLYLTTGWLRGRGPTEPGPTDRMLHWSQVGELAQAGVEIGAHSHAHLQMDTLGSPALRDELRRPRELLEDTLGAPVPSFAYPHGYCGPRVKRATREAGYALAAGVRMAFSRPDDDPYCLARLMVGSTTSEDDVREWLHGRGAPVAGRRESVRTIGWRTYRRSRAVLRRTPGSDYRA